MNKSFARISRAIREGQGALVTSPKASKATHQPEAITAEAKETAKQVEGIAGSAEEKSHLDAPVTGTTATAKPKKKKTLAELDEELRQKMSGLRGDGNEAGVQYDEDGKPIDLKRSVKNNMFRYI